MPEAKGAQGGVIPCHDMLAVVCCVVKRSGDAECKDVGECLFVLEMQWRRCNVDNDSRIGEIVPCPKVFPTAPWAGKTRLSKQRNRGARRHHAQVADMHVY